MSGEPQRAIGRVLYERRPGGLMRAWTALLHERNSRADPPL